MFIINCTSQTSFFTSLLLLLLLLFIIVVAAFFYVMWMCVTYLGNTWHYGKEGKLAEAVWEWFCWETSHLDIPVDVTLTCTAHPSMVADHVIMHPATDQQWFGNGLRC